MTGELVHHLRERGYEARMVPIQRLGDLQEEIEGHHRQGLFDRELYQEYLLSEFTFKPPHSLQGARSLIVVAVPQSQTRVTFAWKGQSVPLIIPPDFLHYQEVGEEVEDLLSGFLAPAGYRAAECTPPLKLLAVRSGLGLYGRNNLCYVPAMGTFHRLVGLFSDLPSPEDNWHESQVMERCEECSACFRACPTGAISSKRFLLHADRCLTFHNEKYPDVPFPSWIDPSWHNCLIGCLRCQGVCPENNKVLGWMKRGPEFSEEDTTLILKGEPLDRLPSDTVDKLEQFGLAEYLGVLPRNLRVFLNSD